MAPIESDDDNASFEASSEGSAIEDDESARKRHRAQCYRFAAATLVHGVGDGLIGIGVAMLILGVQYIGFGSVEGGFLQIATDASRIRRLASVTFGGLFGAGAWYWLRGRQPTFVPVGDSMELGVPMPVGTTVINAAIQDITVAFGGSFGREAAPREICAMWAGLLADFFKVSKHQRRILVACGTGAGLAAVYSVPISGFFYTIEHILEWDMSATAIIPAVTTSCIATVVSAVFVPTDGLYHVPLYSYGYPSWQLLLWSAVVGPLAGGAAALFLRLVGFARGFRPMGRLPVMFKEAPVGHWVTIVQSQTIGDGSKRDVRHRAFITDRTPMHIHVRFEGEDEIKNMNGLQWDGADVEGVRDWSILIGMPAAFFVLALLAMDFPMLLGNGRALAEVAIHRQAELTVLATLLFLKAFVTAGSIGSGVDGGTLTPSVALGATIGAIFGDFYSQLLGPDWAPAPHAREAMSLIAAAAFLAHSMKAPVTGFFLLMEFSAQCIKQEDLILALHGDFSGIIASKLAIGMWLPMGIAVFGSTFFFKKLTAFLSGLCRSGKKKKPLSRRRSASSLDLSDMVTSEPHKAIRRRLSSNVLADDLDLGHDYDDAVNHMILDDNAKTLAFHCYRVCLQLSAVFTLGFASYSWASPSILDYEFVTRLSFSGALFATVCGFLYWCHNFCCASVKTSTGQGAPLLATIEEEGCGGHNSVIAPSHSKAGCDLQQVEAALFVTACSALGGVVPLVPWALQIWHDQGGLTAMVCSAVSVVIATACGALMDARTGTYGEILAAPNTGERPRAVAKQSLQSVVLIAAAVVVGVCTGRMSH